MHRPLDPRRKMRLCTSSVMHTIGQLSSFSEAVPPLPTKNPKVKLPIRMAVKGFTLHTRPAGAGCTISRMGIDNNGLLGVANTILIIMHPAVAGDDPALDVIQHTLGLWQRVIAHAGWLARGFALPGSARLYRHRRGRSFPRIGLNMSNRTLHEM